MSNAILHNNSPKGGLRHARIWAILVMFVALSMPALATAAVAPIALEAESGTLVGTMKVYNHPQASQSKYIQTTTANLGYSNYVLNVSTSGTYWMWVAMLAPSSSADSVHIGVDGKEAAFAVPAGQWSSSWKWFKVTAEGATRSFSLSAGAHSVKIRGRDVGVGVDRFVFTNDPNFAPGSAPSSNQAPVVSAGPDQNVVFPTSASMNGSATDDGLPNGQLTRSWSKVSGPGTVTFSNVADPKTSAAFSVAGTYVLRLTANDGSLSKSDDVQIVTASNKAPSVTAGPDQSTSLSSAASLSGVVTDDGLPKGSLSQVWSQVSGPGTVTFSKPTSLSTSATFSKDGTYAIRLTATDTLLSSTDDLIVTVTNSLTQNVAPQVSAGSDQTLSGPGVTNLSGTASDDGLPAGSSLAAQWSKVSGPGTVTFGAASALATTAAFSTAGNYVVRLAATDGVLTSTDEIAVSVQGSNSSLEFYVAPNGTSSGKGTANDPWSLQYALVRPASEVPPGSTIWLRGGVYRTVAGSTAGSVYRSDLHGTSTDPITVRAYPGESVTLDGGTPGDAKWTLAIAGEHTWVMDLEVTSMSNETRQSSETSGIKPPDLRRAGGVVLNGTGNRLINCVIHDVVSTAVFMVKTPGFMQAYGNVIFNNGWNNANGSGAGHGFYAENTDAARPNLVEANVTGGQFAMGGQFYAAGTANVMGYTITRNVWMNRRLLVGGNSGVVVDQNYVRNNFLFNADLQLGLGANPGKGFVEATGNYIGMGNLSAKFWTTATITNNTVVTPNEQVEADTTLGSGGITFDRNKYFMGGRFMVYGRAANGSDIINQYNFANWKSAMGFDTNSSYSAAMPASNVLVVEANKYDPDRANVVIYNWQNLKVVKVNVSALGWNLGDKYELRNGLDYYNDVISGTYDGSGTIDVPMTGRSVAEPAGWNSLLGLDPFPTFGSFVLIRR